MTITVIGASGNTGKIVASKLLDAGIAVRAVARSAERLADLTRRGATAAIADVTDADALTEALRGSDGVYAMVPPLYDTEDSRGHYARVTEAIAQAVQRSGVRKVVFLSSLGAQLSEGTGPIVNLHDSEERLRKLPGIDLLILRPGYFFENLYSSLGLIKHQGINGGAIAPDVRFAMTATADIGAAAASAFIEGNFSGVTVRELLGERDLSMAEVTHILGQKIGKPDLKYVQFPDEAFAGALQQAGFSRQVAGLFVEMSHAINAGKVAGLEGRNVRNTTPTSFDRFSDTLAAAYQAA